MKQQNKTAHDLHQFLIKNRIHMPFHKKADMMIYTVNGLKPIINMIYTKNCGVVLYIPNDGWQKGD